MRRRGERWTERERERKREDKGRKGGRGNKRKRVEGRRGHRGRRNKFKRKYFSLGRLLVKIPVYIFSRVKGPGDLIAIEFIPTGQAVPLGAIPATRRTLCCSTEEEGERERERGGGKK